MRVLSDHFVKSGLAKQRNWNRLNICFENLFWKNFVSGFHLDDLESNVIRSCCKPDAQDGILMLDIDSLLILLSRVYLHIQWKRHFQKQSFHCKDFFQVRPVNYFFNLLSLLDLFFKRRNFAFFLNLVIKSHDPRKMQFQIVVGLQNLFKSNKDDVM